MSFENSFKEAERAVLAEAKRANAAYAVYGERPAAICGGGAALLCLKRTSRIPPYYSPFFRIELTNKTVFSTTLTAITMNKIHW